MTENVPEPERPTVNDRITVGDRVRIVNTLNPYAVHTHRGRVGKIERIEHRLGGPVYHVRPDGGNAAVDIPATGVVKVETLDDVINRTFGRPDRTVQTPAAPAPVEVLIDVKRAQAAAFAHDLLPKDVDIFDLIHLAEFIVNEHRPEPTPAPAEPAPARNRDADQLLAERGFSCRALSVDLDNAADSDVVEITVEDGTAYLTDAEIDGLIEYLQAAQAARRHGDV